MMGSDYMVKAIACLVCLIGFAGVVTGLTIAGLFMVLLGFALTTVEIEDEVQ